MRRTALIAISAEMEKLVRINSVKDGVPETKQHIKNKKNEDIEIMYQSIGSEKTHQKQRDSRKDGERERERERENG